MNETSRKKVVRQTCTKTACDCSGLHIMEGIFLIEATAKG